MESYMERRLTGLHEVGSSSGFKVKLLSFVIGVVIAILLPFLHLGVVYYSWAKDKPEVNRASCTCDCFDTVNRGLYEWPPTTYKHVYFNSTTNTLKIWLVLVLGILAMYECVRYIVPLIINRKLRIPMFVLLLSGIYPHYYGWWNFYNYLNEDFYPQWWHQVLFSVTEVLSTAMVIHLCNRANRLEPSKLLLVLDVNLMHILIASLDQFIDNIIFHRAKSFEAVRDFGLMLPDCLHVFVCFFELQRLANEKGTRVYRLFYKEELLMSFVLIMLFTLLGKNI